MQRLRLRFSRGAELKYISHLDIIRLWHRAFNRAGIELAYSEGFNPHPRIHLAAPLSLGVTGGSELMDVVVAGQSTSHSLLELVNLQLPPGIKILQVMPVSLNSPSLQAQVREAEYEVEVERVIQQEELEESISKLMAKDTLPWHHQRQQTRREYDLRKLIYNLWLSTVNPDSCVIGMQLKCDSSGAGRPEQVVKALGLPEPVSVHRSRLIFETA